MFLDCVKIKESTHFNKNTDWIEFQFLVSTYSPSFPTLSNFHPKKKKKKKKYEMVKPAHCRDETRMRRVAEDAIHISQSSVYSQERSPSYQPNSKFMP